MNNFCNVQTCTDRGIIDCYGSPIWSGTELKNRIKNWDEIEIKWNSGEIERYVVYMDDYNISISVGIGHSVFLPNSKAYINLQHNKTLIRVYLSNINAKIRKVNQNVRLDI